MSPTSTTPPAPMQAPDPLSTEQRAAMTSSLPRTEPATGEQVRRALSDALSVSGHSHQPLIHERLRRAEGAVPAIVRRLLNAEAEVERLLAERHETNEALSDAAEALRAANTAAGLVAEYHVPTTDGWWLAVRREPNGDRWAIYTASRLILGGRQTWTGDHWISIALPTDSELWNYGSADAALAEATRLAEAGDLR